MFKQKNNKKKHLNIIETLGEKHTNYVCSINEKRNNVYKLKNELSHAKNKLVLLENKELRNENDIKNIAGLKNNINKLNEQIFNIENNVDIMNYLRKTSDIIIDYYNSAPINTYDEQDKNDKINEQNNKIIDITNIEKKLNIKNNNNLNHDDTLKYLNKISQKTRKEKKPVRRRRVLIDQPTGKSILNYINSETTNEKDNNDEQITKKVNNIINKASLYDTYMTFVDKKYTSKKKVNNIVMCDNCNLEKILLQTDGCYICTKCGETEYSIMEYETVVNKEITTEKQKYPYKAINHFREKLNQFQAKENMSVPIDIINDVKTLIIKKRISINKIKPQQIRKILKELKQVKYYEHINQIISRLTGKKPFELSNETVETMLNMFQAMQDSFRKHCPPTIRSNRMSYNYIMHKFFRILGEHECAENVSLLKSREKLLELEFLFAKICIDMGWTNYPLRI